MSKLYNSFKALKRKAIVIGIVLILIIIACCSCSKTGNSKDKVSVLTTMTLQKIIEINQLSTVQSIYNGISECKNDQNTEKVDYYVSYEAIVKAGFDFKDIKITINDELKEVCVVIPEIEITETAVDITSLDYMFINEKADTSSISEEAYKLAISDVKNEVDKVKEIKEIAQQNAKNFIQALLSPFIEENQPDYKLNIT